MGVSGVRVLDRGSGCKGHEASLRVMCREVAHVTEALGTLWAGGECPLRLCSAIVWPVVLQRGSGSRGIAVSKSEKLRWRTRERCCVLGVSHGARLGVRIGQLPV